LADPLAPSPTYRVGRARAGGRRQRCVRDQQGQEVSRVDRLEHGRACTGREGGIQLNHGPRMQRHAAPRSVTQRHAASRSARHGAPGMERQAWSARHGTPCNAMQRHAAPRTFVVAVLVLPVVLLDGVLDGRGERGEGVDQDLLLLLGQCRLQGGTHSCIGGRVGGSP
jgi:hypothetical protein